MYVWYEYQAKFDEALTEIIIKSDRLFAYGQIAGCMAGCKAAGVACGH